MRKRTADFLVRMVKLRTALAHESLTPTSEYTWGRTPCFVLVGGYLPSFFGGG